MFAGPLVSVRVNDASTTADAAIPQILHFDSGKRVWLVKDFAVSKAITCIIEHIEIVWEELLPMRGPLL